MSDPRPVKARFGKDDTNELQKLRAQVRALHNLVESWRFNPHEGGPDVWDILNGCANDLEEIIGCPD